MKVMMRKVMFSLCSTALISTLSFAAKPIDTIKWQTSNGAQVVFYPAKEVPMLDIDIAFAAGSAYDGKHFGLSALTTELLNQGNDGENTSQIADQIAETGAQYQASSSRDMAVISLRTLTKPKALSKALNVFSKIVSKPDFPKAAFLREKNQQLLAIIHSKESPNEIANQTFFKALYQQHPYAHPIIGTSETVRELKRENVVDFYHQYFVGKNATIVMVGAIDKQQAKEVAEKLVQNLPAGKAAKSIAQATSPKTSKPVAIEHPSTQTIIRLGQLGIDHHNPDYFPLMVGNYILGGGALVSQLALEVREKRGLSYGIYSQFIPLPGLGPFVISLATKTEQAKTALEVTQNTLERFVAQGPTFEELKKAKQYMAGSFPLSLASNSNIASMLLKTAFYHLPEDFLDNYISNINSVTVEQVKTAFQHVVHPNQLLEVSVGQM